MAFFTSRPAEDSPTARQPESVEVLRRRAKHRLIGASVLVLAGVVGFPMLFDSQPRPVPVDIQIDMPDKARVAPLQIPPGLEAPASGGTGQVAAGSVGGAPRTPPPISKAPEPKPEPKPDVKPELKAEPKPEPKSEPKPEPKTVEKADAKPKSGEAELRLVIQVGAFAEADKAHEARMKLEHAGLKTYTHVAETKEGKRIRVRVGPFSSQAEADRVALKVKALQLPAQILTL